MELTIWLAFIAGVVSFISPCVLPLVPAYVGYMGGRITHAVAVGGGQSAAVQVGVSRRFTTALHGLFFVAGFTFVFVTLGIFSTAFVSIIGGQNINAVTGVIGRVGGVVIIFFGLHFMGVLPSLFNALRKNNTLIDNPVFSIAAGIIGSILILWGFTGVIAVWDASQWELVPVWLPIIALITLAVFLLWMLLSGAFTTPRAFWTRLMDGIQGALYTDTRRQMNASNQGGYAGSAIMGVIFSAGWTPCIGPVYGAVLTLAANGGSIAQAGVLLTAYSLGLGIPFLLTALLLDNAQSILRRLQRHMHKIELASGAFLVLIGVLVASGQLQSLSQQFAGQYADFSIGVEEAVVDLFRGETEAQPAVPEAAEPTSEASGDLVIANPETSLSSPAEAAEATAAPVAGALASIAELAEASAPSMGISLGNFAPTFETVSDTGQPLRLEDLRGQVVLLNFWATWCGPCRIEMPGFEAAYQEHKDKGFTILAVNNAESAADVQSFRDQLGLSFPIVLDRTAMIQNVYNIFSYPSTFILDREGIIIARHFGPLTPDQIREVVDEALAS